MCGSFVFFWLVISAGLTAWGQQTTLPPPPATHREGVKEVVQGVEIADPYRWLEDQESPETRAWIDAQNRYTHALLDSWPGREALQRRLTELMKIESIGPPRERNGRYFYAKRLPEQDLFVSYVKKGLEGKGEVLIDPHPLSPDHTTSAGVVEISEDGMLVAWEIQRGGEDETVLRFRNVDTLQDLPDELPKALYFGGAFTLDKSGFYYARMNAEGPRVYYHRMGTDPAKDSEIFGKGYGPDKIIFGTLSEDGRYLIITVLHGSAGDTEIYYQDVAAQGPIRPVVNDVAARFFGEVGGDHLYLHTNWKAPKGRILAVNLRNPARERWQEVVPESDSAIESLTLGGGKLLVNYLENASSRIKVFDDTGKFLRDVSLPSFGSAFVVARWASGEAFYGFSSFATPLTIYRYDVASGKQDLWARVKVPIDSEQFEVKQVWYESKDKTRVPMFLVHRKRLKLDGANPTLLTGYGGFNSSETPFFSATAALWMEHGGVFAVPNLRGGGEFGEAWHRAGMLGKKQNVFDDFIAAAEWLIQNHYTSPSKLAIEGASNGGLLVGAALTQRPDLFRAVACGYPLLDMLRYQKFLVAQFWVPEYGSADDPEQFKVLYAYSPYHDVKPGTKYPAVILFSGDADTRVAPLHARKMTALLQTANGSGRPVLLRYETKAGHSRGGLPVTMQIEEQTDVLGFLLWQLNVSFTSPGPPTSVSHLAPHNRRDQPGSFPGRLTEEAEGSAEFPAFGNFPRPRWDGAVALS
jgi:prolyl oligopeptidase